MTVTQYLGLSILGWFAFTSLPFSWSKRFPLLPIPDPTYCRASKPTQILVCDPSGLFSAEHRQDLEREILQIQNDTLSTCNSSGTVRGYTVRLVVVRRYNESLFPVSRTLQLKHKQRMKAYATFLHKQFLTDDNCDDSVLIFISKDDKSVLLVAGKEVSNLVPYELQKWVRKRASGRLLYGDVLGASKECLRFLGDALRFGPDRVILNSSSQQKRITATVVAVSVVLVLAMGGLIYGVVRWRRKRRRLENVDESVADDPAERTRIDSSDEGDSTEQSSSEKYEKKGTRL